MFCEKCGSVLEEKANFCTKCGAEVLLKRSSTSSLDGSFEVDVVAEKNGGEIDEEDIAENTLVAGSVEIPTEERGSYGATGEPFDIEAQPTNAWEYNDRRRHEVAANALKWGILSIVFSGIGYTSLLGFIFSLVAKKKCKKYYEQYTVADGRVRTARILSTVAIVYTFTVGLFIAFYIAIYLIAVIFALMGTGI